MVEATDSHSKVGTGTAETSPEKGTAQNVILFGRTSDGKGLPLLVEDDGNGFGRLILGSG